MRVLRLALWCTLLAVFVRPFEAHAQARDTTRAPVRDSTVRDTTVKGNLGTLFGVDSNFTIDLLTRIEARGERTKNDRCIAGQFVNNTFRCSAPIQPAFDFQFALKSGGSIADRVKVDVDYDSQREFDASNNISLYFEGKPNELFQRVELGNVFFQPPPSRFLTSGIPSGNYGLQAIGHIGNMRFAAILAQQKGNVVKDQVFQVGTAAIQNVEREIEDYQIEPRRFFFTIDPRLFGSRYPNIDILDRQQLRALSASLPDTIRPSRVSLYRLLIGGQPANPNGPRFTILDDPTSRPAQAYELLRENIDYYLDPSQLWFSLVRPLSLNNERLVVAYTVNLNGRETVLPLVGGTPDLDAQVDRAQYANLIWDPQIIPDDPAFRKEIRSIYRLGGEDLKRESVALRIISGSGADQEKPPGGAAPTYLNLFGLSQANNSSTFDAQNRIWPRPGDPNFTVNGAQASLIIRDRFVVFPSLQPFARTGLARPPAVPANDTLYRTPNEYLYSSQHPQSFYRLRARYDVEGTAGVRSLALASVQLRPESERITMDGRLLMRGIDYDIDYDLGRVTFLRPDTLLARPHRVVVQYEENPLFQAIPTSLFGLTTQWTLPHGEVGFTALSQSQRTTFTRPPLGFEPAASLVAGVNGAFGWDVAPLSRLLARALPLANRDANSRLEVNAEVAVSQPRQRATQQAYIESFEGEGGTQVSAFEAQWQFSSQPALGARLPQLLSPAILDTTRATTMSWQNNGTNRAGQSVTFSIRDIDPLAQFAGAGFAAPEQILWLNLYPLGVGGLIDAATQRPRWPIPDAPRGRRWRSIRTPLGQNGAGIDLSRVEQLEFWTLVDTNPVRRRENPTLLIDLGDVSENSVRFAPETLTVMGIDSLWSGKQLQGLDTLDSERDPFSRTFSADVNDLGLAGDLVRRLAVRSDAGTTTLSNTPTCNRGGVGFRALGDATANCTVRNDRLDEEDIDQDGALNFTTAERERERLRRYVVDLSLPVNYSRVGKCNVQIDDVLAGGRASRCWVLVRVPFKSPTDSTNGGPLLRRVRALRLTMISGELAPDDRFTLLPLTRLRLVGAPWLKRAERPLRGIGGEESSLGGFVIATVIGTQDKDSASGLVYEPPPGVVDQPDQQQPIFGGQVQINERSMRLLAGGLGTYDRAETYFRFPEGQRSVMTYRELRVWARGRGNGWGSDGDLQFFIKLGRDANNFYLYRTSANAGAGRAAWEPEVRVRFERFYELRSKLQTAWLQKSGASLGCTGVDSALIARSGLPIGTRIDRYAACADGYMVYTVDPAVTPPNLGAVQELAVGIVRVDSLRGSSPPMMNDTLEVWVDDIRLADIDNKAGYAGQFGMTLTAGDVGSIRVSAARRDANFRQLGEQPTFLNNEDLDVISTIRLDKLLPRSLGLLLPLTITHTASGADPRFLTRSDIAAGSVNGLRTPRTNVTTYALSVRAAQPVTGKWYAPIVNHLGLTGTWGRSGNRSEYQDGRTRDANLGLEFVASPSPGISLDTAPPLPPPPGDTIPPIDRPGRGIISAPWRVLQQAPRRLTPTQVRLYSAVVRNDDRRESFLTPGAAPDDSGRVVRGEQDVWRTVAGIELQPWATVTARLDAVSLRDLREYGDSTPSAIAAGRVRNQLLGMDVGLERERSLQAAVSFAPRLAAWVRPRLDVNSTYSLVRDPNNRSVVTIDSVGEPLLPARLGNSQGITAAAFLDLGAAVRAGLGEGWIERLVSLIGPLDLAVNRATLSAFDGAPFTPGWDYQFSIVPDGFRELRGVLASSAGVSTQYSASHMMRLPLGATLSNRAQRVDTKNWTRRLTERQSRVDGLQQTFPDITFRWSGSPRLIRGIFSSLGANARLLESRQSFLAPRDIPGAPAELRATHVRSWPLSASAVSAIGAVTMSAAFERRDRIDSLPGSVTEGTTREITGDLGKSFGLPRDWAIKNTLRTRASYQRTETRSFVSNDRAVGNRSRLTDNGRRAVSLNADTDLADNMTFSLQGSRVVTFDRNFNRRFTQTVFAAVLQLQFFGGASR